LLDDEAAASAQLLIGSQWSLGDESRAHGGYGVEVF
jgi:hypothetical protein